MNNNRYPIRVLVTPKNGPYHTGTLFFAGSHWYYDNGEDEIEQISCRDNADPFEALDTLGRDLRETGTEIAVIDQPEIDVDRQSEVVSSDQGNANHTFGAKAALDHEIRGAATHIRKELHKAGEILQATYGDETRSAVIPELGGILIYGCEDDLPKGLRYIHSDGELMYIDACPHTYLPYFVEALPRLQEADRSTQLGLAPSEVQLTALQRAAEDIEEQLLGFTLEN